MRRPLFSLLTLTALVLAACSSSDESGAETASTGLSSPVSAGTEAQTTESATTESATTAPAAADPSTTEPVATDSPVTSTVDETVTTALSSSAAALIADRPFDVFVPSSYDAATPMPLVVLLHGYTGTGDTQEGYFKFEPLAEARGFLYVHPDGTTDATGAQYWNATDACCSFGTNTPDDSAYLTAILDQVSSEYNVDPKRIFLSGHSNGGFMSYRMACDHADRIAAVASLAGATFADTATCTPSEPVSVLQVHGTDDAVVGYQGDDFGGASVPSAEQTVATWAGYNDCGTTPTAVEGELDLDKLLEGADSTVQSFSCAPGIDVELWTIDGGSHSPALSEEFTLGVVDFLLAHPKP
jgi:polyhydroxybutyrate depolymerase